MRLGALTTAFTLTASLGGIYAPAAEACAVCSCGDPTLTTMGAEQPFEGRIRAATDTRYREDRIGAAEEDQLTLREVKTDLSLSWAPSTRLTLAASAPVLWREVTTVSLARTRIWGLGDVDARLRVVLYRDRAFAPKTLVSATAGALLPTAPTLTLDGEALPASAQPGAGSLTPLVGLTAARFLDPVSFYASLSALAPLPGGRDLTPGPSLRATLAGQLQPHRAVSVRASLEGRLDAVATEGGEPEADSGGAILFAGADLLLSPAEDWILRVGGAAPVFNALKGDHVESAIASAGVIYDF